MEPEIRLSRRRFLQASALAGAELTLAIYLSGCNPAPTPTEAPAPTAEPTQATVPTLEPTLSPMPTAGEEPTLAPEPSATAEPASPLEPNIYLTIDHTGTVTIRAFRSEMGQGIRTAIAMIVAEELDADWAAVRVEQVPADPAYGNQVTGGSASVSEHYTALRQAGASARQMLVTAAAAAWEVEVEACRTESGSLIHPDGEQRLAYGALVGPAAEVPVPKGWEVELKEPKDFVLIGKPVQHYDAGAMVDGSALYGSDIQVPGMLYASVARCPEFGGGIASFDASTSAGVAGVRDVLEIESGIAVVAENSWSAIEGRDALAVTWSEGAYAGWSSESIRQGLVDRAPKPGGAAADPSGSSIDAVYDIPYLAHATMEPMTCVADVRAGSCEVWAPSQTPQAARQRARSITGLRQEDVTVHVPLIGGGFGRRHGTDYVEEAVQISQAVGAPIKLVWTREDDMRHDLYHPQSHTYAGAELDDSGQPSRLPRVQIFEQTSGVPIGYWRSVGNFTQAFARESFLDEVAAEGGLDPYELRSALLSGRAKAVVDLAAEKADWGSALPEGRARGMAYWATFGVTHVAHVAEVSVTPEGEIQVHRVVCAVDCGTVINPDTVAAQMEGGIVYGLTAALKAKITIEDGKVQEGNFHDYPLLTMSEMPVIEVHIVPSEESPSGIGEMGVPPIAPAVANAVYALTGQRIRVLPLRLEA